MHGVLLAPIVPQRAAGGEGTISQQQMLSSQPPTREGSGAWGVSPSGLPPESGMHALAGNGSLPLKDGVVAFLR